MKGGDRLMVTKINDKLHVWGSDIEPNTIRQAERTARLPIIAGHVALMPDAHVGMGATVGSVVPTEGAIIPATVGVDIGCGMTAARTTLTAEDLPDSLDPLLGDIAKRVPAGVGQGHDRFQRRADVWLASNQPRTKLDGKLGKKAHTQLGSLGSGNHFVEVSLDESGTVWVVLHSGSRGIGNILAQGHIRTAKAAAAHAEIALEDPDLSWLIEGTDEFDHYIADLRWAQAYAFENRDIMLDRVLDAVFAHAPGTVVDTVACHHNYTEQETHLIDGTQRTVWVTRKGAIRAREGDKGIIPGSMGTATYIVEGLGHPGSFHSSSHGAGRRMSRGQAKRELDEVSLTEAMEGRTWLAGSARSLVDEHPLAYKDIEDVMEAQADLARVTHRLEAVLNYKGI